MPMEYHYTPPEKTDEEKKRPVLVIDDAKAVKPAKESAAKPAEKAKNRFRPNIEMPKLKMDGGSMKALFLVVFLMAFAFSLGSRSGSTGNVVAITQLDEKVDDSLTTVSKIQASVDSSESKLRNIESKVSAQTTDTNQQYSKILQELSECADVNSAEKEGISKDLAACEANGETLSEKILSLERARDMAKGNVSACETSLSDLDLEYESLARKSAKTLCCLRKELGDMGVRYYFVKDGIIKCADNNDAEGSMTLDCE